MTNLFRHLRKTGNLWRYLRLVCYRHKRGFAQAAAFVILALAVAYSINSVQNQREERTNDILASLADGAVQGCIAQNQNVTQPLRVVLVDSYTNSIDSVKRLVSEGTLTVPQGDRILKDSRQQTIGYLITVRYRDCTAAGIRYTRQISAKSVRNRAEGSVRSQANEAKSVLAIHEPKLPKSS